MFDPDKLIKTIIFIIGFLVINIIIIIYALFN